MYVEILILHTFHVHFEQLTQNIPKTSRLTTPTRHDFYRWTYSSRLSGDLYYTPTPVSMHLVGSQSHFTRPIPRACHNFSLPSLATALGWKGQGRRFASVSST